MPVGIYPRRPVAERLWAKVDRRGPDECWPWIGGTTEGGYGTISDNGRLRPAHRVAWEVTTGRAMAPELNACHSCDNPPCCNPTHIFPGTHLENMADAIRKGRTRNGVSFGEANGRAKLSVEQVRAIRERHASGSGRTALAREYGVSTGTIDAILSGRNWPQIAVAVLVFTLLLVGRTSADTPESPCRLLAIYGSTSAADLLSTEFALSRGAREGNPLMRNRGVRIAYAVGSTALLVWSTQELQRTGHPKAARWLKRIAVAVRVGVAAHAVKVGLERDR